MKKIVLSLLLLCLAGHSQAQNVNALKAAYVFYFSKFISWEQSPLSNLDTINICFRDDDYAIQKQFYSLTGKTNGSKPLKIIDINDMNMVTTVCHILYSSTINEELFNKNPYALLVSNEDQSLADVNFLVVNNKLRFNINREKTEVKNLKISSRLLRLAAKVNQE